MAAPFHAILRGRGDSVKMKTARWAFMFDDVNPYWNGVWLAIICLGGVSFGFGAKLLMQRKR